MQQVSKVRRSTATRSSPAAAKHHEAAGSAHSKPETGGSTAVAGQELRSGRHRPLPIAAQRPSPPKSVEARGKGEHDVEEGSPPHPPPGQRFRSVRSLVKKRSLGAAPTLPDEMEKLAAKPEAAAKTPKLESQKEAPEGAKAASNRPAVRLLRSRPGNVVPPAEKLASDILATHLEGDGRDRGAAAAQRQVVAPPEVLQRPRTRLPTAKRALQATLARSGGEDDGQAQEVEGMDVDDGSDAHAADAFPDDGGPMFSSGEAPSPSKVGPLVIVAAVHHVAQLLTCCTCRSVVARLGKLRIPL